MPIGVAFKGLTTIYETHIPDDQVDCRRNIMPYTWSYCPKCDKFQGPKKTECPTCGKPTEPVEAKWGAGRIVGQILFLLSIFLLLACVIAASLTGLILLYFVPLGPLFIALILFLILGKVDESGKKKKISQEYAGKRGPPPPPSN